MTYSISSRKLLRWLNKKKLVDFSDTINVKENWHKLAQALLIFLYVDKLLWLGSCWFKSSNIDRGGTRYKVKMPILENWKYQISDFKGSSAIWVQWISNKKKLKDLQDLGKYNVD